MITQALGDGRKRAPVIISKYRFINIIIVDLYSLSQTIGSYDIKE